MAGSWNDDIRARTAAIIASLEAALPARTIKRGLLHYDDHGAAELAQGVVMLISDAEQDYSRALGMVAKEPTHRLILVGHLKVAETQTPADLEDAEQDLIEELKAWIRTGLDGMDLLPEAIQQSRQLEHPYGWIVAYVDAVPPRSNLY
jgi:hypothetical protein